MKSILLLVVMLWCVAKSFGFPQPGDHIPVPAPEHHDLEGAETAHHGGGFGGGHGGFGGGHGGFGGGYGGFGGGYGGFGGGYGGYGGGFGNGGYGGFGHGGHGHHF